MLSLLTAILLASQPAHGAAPARTSWVFATVGHSEWCPAGNVRLDLRTGNYAFTATAPPRTCNTAGVERPVAMGRLRPGRLFAIRAAATRLWAEGPLDPACREGGRPQGVIVVGSGGMPILVATNGARTVSAPDDLACWSAAAQALHDRLDETFGLTRGR